MGTGLKKAGNCFLKFGGVGVPKTENFSQRNYTDLKNGPFIKKLTDYHVCINENSLTKLRCDIKRLWLYRFDLEILFYHTYMISSISNTLVYPY